MPHPANNSSRHRHPRRSNAPLAANYAKVAMPFVTSGIAACFASCCIHPIDLAKVRLQLFALQNPGMPKPS